MRLFSYREPLLERVIHKLILSGCRIQEKRYSSHNGDGSAEFIAPTSPGSLQFTLTASLSTGELYSDQTTVTVVVDKVTESSGGGGCAISTNSSHQSFVLILMIILSTLFLISKKCAYIRIHRK